MEESQTIHRHLPVCEIFYKSVSDITNIKFRFIFFQRIEFNLIKYCLRSPDDDSANNIIMIIYACLGNCEDACFSIYEYINILINHSFQK